jgi:hypothetical protein
MDIRDWSKELTQATKVGPPYFVVITDEGAEVRQFESKQDLLTALRQIRDEETQAPFARRVKIFHGSRVFLSKGDFKYVLFPDGNKVPLFIPDLDKLEPDEDGVLIERRQPEAPLEPDVEKPDQDEDEESDWSDDKDDYIP